MAERSVVPLEFRIRNYKALQAANTELKKMGGNTGYVAQATKSTNRFGSSMQNASYQVQDFVVQVGGGVEPMRALSQQLPQLLGPLGSLGAVVGVAAAALPLLVVAFKQLSGESLTLEEAIKNLDETMGRMDTDKFVAEFNKATEAQRGFLIQAQLFEVREAEQALRDRARAAQELTEKYERLTQQTEALAEGQEFVSRQFGAENAGMAFLVASGRVDSLTESLGLTREQFEQLVPVIRQASEEQYGNAETMETLLASINQMVEDMEGEVTPELRAYVESLKAATQAAKDLKAAQDRLNEAKGAPIGQDIGTPPAPPPAPPVGRPGRAGNQPTYNDPYGIGVDIGTGDWGSDNSTPWGDTDGLIDSFGKVDEAVQQLSASTSLFNEIGQEAFESLQRSTDIAFDGLIDGSMTAKEAFSSMVESMIKDIAKLIAKWAAAQIVSMFVPGFGPLTANARGNAISGGNVLPFARGGVVSSPTLFPMAKGAGLMGEAGPEGILPLKRTRTGDLGVQASGMSVIINNMAPGVEARPRQTDRGTEIDLVLNAVAADLARGGGPVSQTLERTYGVGRGRGVY